MARPISPVPTTRACVPATRSDSRWRQVRSCCSRKDPGKSLAKERTCPRTYSAMAPSKTPRELVSTMSLARTSGVISGSTPVAAMCTHCTDPAACQASASAVLRKS